MTASSPRTLRFKDFEIDAANNVLTRDGIVVKLPPQPFKVLVLLIERRGTLVTRDVLRQAIWGEDTVVDFEHGLNTCIRQIRVALGDEAESPRFIQTIPRLGYRFTAAVTSVADQKSEATRWRGAAAGAALTLGVVGLLITLGGGLRTGLRSPGVRPLSVQPDVRELYVRGRLALERHHWRHSHGASALRESHRHRSELRTCACGDGAGIFTKAQLTFRRVTRDGGRESEAGDCAVTDA